MASFTLPIIREACPQAPALMLEISAAPGRPVMLNAAQASPAGPGYLYAVRLALGSFRLDFPHYAKEGPQLDSLGLIYALGEFEQLVFFRGTCFEEFVNDYLQLDTTRDDAPQLLAWAGLEWARAGFIEDIFETVAPSLGLSLYDIYTAYSKILLNRNDD